MENPIGKPAGTIGHERPQASPFHPEGENGAEPRKPVGIFRADFLREHRKRSQAGDVVRVSPGWVAPAFWLVLAFSVIGLAYGILGQVREYAVGPAVVRFSDRADLTALTDGTVIDVAVHAGEVVRQGQTLVRFYSGEESTELERVEREFQLELVNLLRDPSDQDSRQSMARLRSERDRLRSRLGERIVRSPIEGSVSDVRIRPGQHLSVGDPVMKILGGAPQRIVVAAIPGQYRPLLKSGLPLKLRLNGYPYAHEDLQVSSIGDEVVGPDAIRRYLGADIGDAVPVSGPAVLVYARLLRPGFRWEGSDRPYYDGMVGRAEVSVRDQPVALALIPGLRQLAGRAHD